MTKSDASTVTIDLTWLVVPLSPFVLYGYLFAAWRIMGGDAWDDDFLAFFCLVFGVVCGLAAWGLLISRRLTLSVTIRKFWRVR